MKPCLKLANRSNEDYEEGLKVGLAEGHAEAKYEDVDALVSKGVLDATSACEVLGVPLEDYERHKQS